MSTIAKKARSSDGESQHENLFGASASNELFADHEGSKYPPWWLLSSLLGPSGSRITFGPWDGVFTSCLINIFGVIIFLRSGWIVGEAGMGEAAIIVLAAICLILTAVLAAIGICERCHVQAGGVYFLIAHVLGNKKGTAVGLVYIMGQAIGNALCATGFAEAIAGLVYPNSPFVERIIALLVIVVLTAINSAGVKWVVRIQFGLLILLLLGAADLLLGGLFRRPINNNENSQNGHGFVGWNASVWRSNSGPQYSEGEDFFSVFGVFFPALTGVMAGINMSGDLQNPAKDISLGTLAAVATASFLYLMFMVVLAGSCERWALLTDYMIAEKASLFGFLLLTALYLSSISSCLATLYGTPRVLQSIAEENVLPALKSLAIGKGPNKVPINSLLLISLVTILFILIGDMNRLATLATIPFLLTYATIEYAYFALCMQFDLNQRRLADFRAGSVKRSNIINKNNTGNNNGNNNGNGVVSSASEESLGNNDEFEQLLEKYNVDEIEERPDSLFSILCNRWISLIACMVKVLMLFLIHWGYALLCLGLCVSVYSYIGKTASAVSPGIAAEFSLHKYIRKVFNQLRGASSNSEEETQLMVNTTEPCLTTRSAHINEINSDFADRTRIHQTQSVRGSHFTD